MASVDELVASGEIGGRTVRIVESGAIECYDYPAAALKEGQVRVRTVRSAISSGTELTFYGQGASNVHLHKPWNERLRLFESGRATPEYPLVFGYRAAGEVIESRAVGIRPGHRVYGNWRHTELTTLPAAQALAQTLPPELSWDDGVDVGQMGPICVNAIASAEGRHHGAPVVVFGAGPIGLLTAQIARADGAAQVYVVDLIPSRLAVVEDLGLVPVTGDAPVHLKETLGADGVPVVFECSGSSIALHEAIRTVRRRGLVVAVGFYQGEAQGLRLGEEFHHNGVQLVSAQIGNIHPTYDWASLRDRVIGLCGSGAVRFGSLPRETFRIEDVAAAMAALTRPERPLQVALTYG